MEKEEEILRLMNRLLELVENNQKDIKEIYERMRMYTGMLAIAKPAIDEFYKRKKDTPVYIQ